MATTNKLTQREREEIIFAVTYHGCSQRETADMYVTSHTTVQRLLKQYANFPENFPGVKKMQEDAMYADREIEHVVLSTPEIRIDHDEYVMDLSGTCRTYVPRATPPKDTSLWLYVACGFALSTATYVGFVLYRAFQ